MRTFGSKLVALAATAALSLTLLAAPATTAHADQYAPEKADKYSLTVTGDYCKRVSGTQVKLKIKNSIKNGKLLCKTVQRTTNNGALEQTTTKVYKYKNGRIDVVVSLSKKNHVDHFYNDGTGTILRIDSEPWRMQFKPKGKSASWLWQNYYKYHNRAASAFSIGSLYMITGEYLAGPMKGDEIEAFESRLRLYFYF